ncbi:MAG: hypothetical protein R6V16_08665, partial [Bacteroidales bacterium]
MITAFFKVRISQFLRLLKGIGIFRIIILLCNAVLRVITRMKAPELIKELREKGYPVTKVDAQGK